jgi:hypothetical protein
MVALPPDSVPLESEPIEIIEHRLDEAGLRPIDVEVFEAKQDLRTLGSRIEPTEKAREQGSRVRTASRRGGEAAPFESRLEAVQTHGTLAPAP